MESGPARARWKTTTPSEGSGRPCSHLNNLAATLSRPRGQQPAENVDLAFLCDVTPIALGSPLNMHTIEENLGSKGALHPPIAPWARVTFSARVSQVAPEWPPSPLASSPPPRLYNVYWATLRLTLQSAIAKRVSIIATHWRNRMNQTQEVK